MVVAPEVAIGNVEAQRGFRVSARIGFLVFAILIYAIFGSPTPDNPSGVEVFIALALVLAVGLGGVLQVARLDVMAPLWFGSGQVLLLYGLSVPLVVAAAMGNAPVAVLRDVLPFLFMLLPLFMARQCGADVRSFRILLIAVLALGALFAVRALQEAYGSPLLFFLRGGDEGELTYFANMPTVLFAALYLAGWGAAAYMRRPALRRLMLCFLCVLGAVIVLLPVVMSAQRASLGYVVVYALALGAVGFVLYPYRVLPFAVVFGLGVLVFWPVLAEVMAGLLQKNTLVGFNMRFQELVAVWDEISVSPLRVMFGAGWGGYFNSPAVGGLSVGFTHNLLSSFVLKTGLVGAFFAGLYLYGVARALVGVVERRFVLGLALAGPFLIDVFLYASYKSLDFGLLLLVISSANSLLKDEA